MYLYFLIDSQVIKTALEDFKVMNKVDLGSSIPFDFMQWNFLWIPSIQQLAINVSST